MSIDTGNYAFTSEETNAELSRILESSEFAASDQLSRFLKYIVEESLAGRADRIKERNIAVKALGREADFDSRLDSIVRVVAGKLRKALDRYYALDGAENPLRIEVPKGRYQPVVCAAEQVGSEEGGAAEQPNALATKKAVTNEFERPAERPASLKPADAPLAKSINRAVLALVGCGLLGLAGAVVLLASGVFSRVSNAKYSPPQIVIAKGQVVEQTGALPYRVRNGVVEVLIVRTLRDSHWTLPKATQPSDVGARQTAAAEAIKEAGARGTATQPVVGQYFYERNNNWYRVTVYPVLVEEELASWPEDSRRREWHVPATAGEMIASNTLADLVRGFVPNTR